MKSGITVEDAVDELCANPANLDYPAWVDVAPYMYGRANACADMLLELGFLTSKNIDEGVAYFWTAAGKQHIKWMQL